MKTRAFSNVLIWSLATFVAENLAQDLQTGSHDVLTEYESVADLTLIVVHADIPRYPSLALAARQSGTVRLRISVKNGNVLIVDTKTSGPPVFVNAAKENVGTWRFTSDTYGTFEVTYIYELAKEESMVLENPHIELQLPSRVKITAKPVKAMPLHGN